VCACVCCVVCEGERAVASMSTCVSVRMCLCVRVNMCMCVCASEGWRGDNPSQVTQCAHLVGSGYMLP